MSEHEPKPQVAKLTHSTGHSSMTGARLKVRSLVNPVVSTPVVAATVLVAVVSAFG